MELKSCSQALIHLLLTPSSSLPLIPVRTVSRRPEWVQCGRGNGGGLLCEYQGLILVPVACLCVVCKRNGGKRKSQLDTGVNPPLLLGARALHWVGVPSFHPYVFFCIYFQPPPSGRHKATFTSCESVRQRVSPGQTHTHRQHTGGSLMVMLIQMYMPISPLHQQTRRRD